MIPWWVLEIEAGWWLLALLLHVGSVGQERKPITGAGAAVAVVLSGFWMAVNVLAGLYGVHR